MNQNAMPRWPRDTRSGALLMALMALAGCMDSGSGTRADGEDAWTLIALPDTQGYVSTYTEILRAQTRWIAEEAEARSIAFVVHEGDLTDHHTRAEWDVVRESFALFSERVPFAVVPGNHDYDPARARSSLLSTYFPPFELRQAETLGGLYDDASSENSYHRFSAGGEAWLVVALEFGPRDEVIAWANEIIAAHPEHRVIVLTHAYLYIDSTRYDWQQKGASQSWSPHSYSRERFGVVNDGEELWQKLVSKHANIELVLCGHAAGPGIGRVSSRGAGAGLVHQVLANFQDGPRGGEGYLREMKIFRDRIEVSTYSPYLDRYLTTPEHSFTLSRRAR